MRITFVNDTRIETNPGCHATVTGLLHLLQATTGADVRTVPLGAGHERFAPMVASGHARSATHWREAVAQLAKDDVLRSAVEDTDLVVVNLEGTFHHHTVGALALGGLMALAHQSGVPVWAVNGTVEDIDLWLLQETLARASHLAVREPLSAAWLRARGLRASLAADCAVLANVFAVPLTFSMPARAALYTPGVLARPDQEPAMSADVVMGHLAELDRAGYTPIYLEMEVAETPIAERVRAGGGHVLRAVDVPWQAVGTLLQHCDLVVSGRYHVLIFAAMAGVPAVALPSNTWKVEGLLAHVDAARSVVGPADTLAGVLASRRTATPVPEAVARMRTLALRNVAGHPLARVSTSRASRVPVVIGPSPDADPAVAELVRAHVRWPIVPADVPPAVQLSAALEITQRRSVASITVAGLDACLPEHVPDALLALRDVAKTTIRVVVDPTPGIAWEAVHRTVRPLSVWRRMFVLAGFEVAEEEPIDAGATATTTDGSLASHWASLRPFRDLGDQGRCVFLLRPSDVRLDRRRPAMMAALGLRMPVALPAAIADGCVRPVFLVGTYQEFRQYLPIWAQLPPSAFTVLIRHDDRAEAQRRQQIVESWLRSRRVPVQVIRSVRDIVWDAVQSAGQRGVLVTGAESTAYDSHLWNAAVVIAAKAQGLRTLQMQHGIWPYADLERPMAWLSDRVLAWSREFERSCREVVTWPDGTIGPRAELGDVAFDAVGCPVFDAYAEAGFGRLEDLLGEWVTRYRRRVLVATNLHWTQHHAGARVTPAVLELASRTPDTLFVIKPHPVHDMEAALVASCPANVVVLDEYCCLAAGLDSPRLIRACDATIATQSTMVLEAALAAKPFVVVDSGNPNHYEHVTLVAPDRLGPALEAAVERGVARAGAFVDHYFDRATLGAGTEAVLKAIARTAEAGARPASSLRREDVALSRFSEYLSVYAAEVVRMQAGLAAAREAVARIEADYRALQAHASSSSTDVTAERARFEATITELSGRHQELEELAAAHAADLLARRQGRRLKVVLFGASTGGRRTLEAARQVPHLEVIGFADNDRARWASQVDGVPVCEPDPRWLRTADAIVITSIHGGPIAAQVAAAGCADRLVRDASVLERMALRSRTA